MPTKLPLVTVVTSTHNRPTFLRKAIEGFCGQTWPNKEMVIMNDGDYSHVPKIDGLPIRHVHSSGYEGMTRKQRWAYEIARGDYIANWDDDDFFGATRLERQATALLEGKADACGFPIDLIAQTSPASFWRWKPPVVEAWKRPDSAPKPPGYAVPFHDGSVMFKRARLDGIPENIREGWQLGLIDEMRKRGARLISLPNAGSFVYVRHGGNAWAFKTEEKCDAVARPDWLPQAIVDFWNDPKLSPEATSALRGRGKDHNGL